MPKEQTIADLAATKALGPMVFQSRAQAEQAVAQSARKLYGYSRKPRPNLPKTPDLYIFNVSTREFRWKQPGFDNYIIKACPKGEDCSEATVIAGIVTEEYLNDRQTELNHYNGEEIIQAILQFGPGMPPSGDLRRFGCFYSRFNPPLAEEIEEARKRMNHTCVNLVGEADEIFRMGESKGLDGRRIGTEHKWALAQSHQERDWSKTVVKMDICPGCQNSIPPGVVVHTCGAVLDWSKAISLGIKKESDRPAPEVSEQKGKARN